MTEAEWLRGPAIWLMLEFLRGTSQVRKLRLFACACCRRVWNHLTDARSRTAVEALESEADDPHSFFHLNPEASLRAAEGTSRFTAAAVASSKDSVLASRHAAWTVLHAAEDVTVVPAVTSLSKAISAAGTVVEEAEGRCVAPIVSAVDGGELMAQSDLLLDIFGNPFRPITISPSILAWNDSLVVRLAQAAYEERHLASGTLDNGRLAVLADALEEAGCGNKDILQHLRQQGGVHVRGCWPVDLCLGKS